MFFECSVDWEKQAARLLNTYQIVVPTAVIKELEILSKRGTSERKRKAKASLKFVSRYKTIDTGTENADDAIIEAAKKTQGVVFTNDAELRKRLRDDGIPVLLLRGRKKLALEE